MKGIEKKNLWKAAAVLIFAFVIPASAQMREPPVAPQPKPEAAEMFKHAERRKTLDKKRLEAPAHRFYDKPAKIELGVNAALLAADSAITCRNLANGGREQFLPTQSCAGVVAIMAGEHAGQEALAWTFHKTNHHKLERLARLYMTVAHIAALAYTAAQ